jgi:hypothetical protein
MMNFGDATCPGGQHAIRPPLPLLTWRSVGQQTRWLDAVNPLEPAASCGRHSSLALWQQNGLVPGLLWHE